jgi:hypothetical protein
MTRNRDAEHRVAAVVMLGSCRNHHHGGAEIKLPAVTSENLARMPETSEKVKKLYDPGQQTSYPAIHGVNATHLAMTLIY